MKHKHYDVLVQWLADTTLELEYKYDTSNWRPNNGRTPLSHPGYEWRIKPNMVKVGRHEWPMPLSVAPEMGTVYWLACSGSVVKCRWVGDPSDLRGLRVRGIHLTAEAAQQHADALVCINKGDIQWP